MLEVLSGSDSINGERKTVDILDLRPFSRSGKIIKNSIPERVRWRYLKEYLWYMYHLVPIAHFLSNCYSDKFCLQFITDIPSALSNFPSVIEITLFSALMKSSCLKTSTLFLYSLMLPVLMRISSILWCFFRFRARLCYFFSNSIPLLSSCLKLNLMTYHWVEQ